MAKKKEINNKTLRNLESGVSLVKNHPMFSTLMRYVNVYYKEYHDEYEGYGWVCNLGYIYLNKNKRLEPEEWAYILAHCLLHLGLNQFRQDAKDNIKWNVACDIYNAKFLEDMKFGKVPKVINNYGKQIALSSEEKIYNLLLRDGISNKHIGFGTSGHKECDMFYEKETYKGRVDLAKKFPDYFAIGLAEAVTSAVSVAAGYSESIYEDKKIGPAKKAINWFISSYPLLGSIATNFKVITDSVICTREDIQIAAVNDYTKELYFNPACGLNEEEYKFVIAHELLHVGLRHSVRREGRDHYLWNVACDYVINSWLIEMKIGEIPQLGLLYDEELKDLSAESIYDIIVTDMRKYRKLMTLRGTGIGDILENKENKNHSIETDLDEFYRRSLSQGLEYHIEEERGYIPAGLVEEIKALYEPPIPWDVELAKWFDKFFQPIEKVRTYARQSRRQSSTPDIPRPKYVYPEDKDKSRTFGVVLDTSGSMDRVLLGQALGAISSYAISRDVSYVRVVFCDAVAYDEGYMSPEEIANRVKVKGRGGTVLQPGINLLEKALDFPKNGPILIITDGYCDKVAVKRDHAYIIPKGRNLPFVAKGEVFKME